MMTRAWPDGLWSPSFGWRRGFVLVFKLAHAVALSGSERRRRCLPFGSIVFAVRSVPEHGVLSAAMMFAIGASILVVDYQLFGLPAISMSVPPARTSRAAQAFV